MTRAAHVVFVTTSYPARPFDPAGHFVETEAREHAARGARVTVLAPTPARPGANDERQCEDEREKEIGLGTVHVEWLPGGDAFGAPGVIERLREDPRRLVHVARYLHAARRRLTLLSPDLVVAHWLVPSAWPVAARTRAQLEIVAHGSDVGLVERLPRPVRLAIVRGLVRRGATFRFVSHDLAERLARATDERVLDGSVVAPSPIDVRAAPARERARAVLGVGVDERLAVIVSRLVPGKRVDVAIRMARAAGAERVVVVGDGPARARLSSSGAGVELVGAVPRDRALTWIAAADLLVSASRDEGAPTVVREARALGVPVLAVPAGDLRRWAAADPEITLQDA